MSEVNENDLGFGCQHNFMPSSLVPNCPACEALRGNQRKQSQLDRIEEMLKKLLSERV